MSKFLISCDDAAILITRKQYKDLTKKDRFKIMMHNIICGKCKRFEKKSKQFTREVNDVKWAKLSQEQKVKLKEALHKELR